MEDAKRAPKVRKPLQGSEKKFTESDPVFPEGWCDFDACKIGGNSWPFQLGGLEVFAETLGLIRIDLCGQKCVLRLNSETVSKW